MLRIEDAVTARGIKFVRKNESHDWMPASGVMDYIYKLIGVRRKWRNVYNWIHLGLAGNNDKRVYLKFSTLTDGKYFVRKVWVRNFLDAVRRGTI